MTVASFIASQRTEHGVSHALSCRALEVPESTFYKWHNRPPTPRHQRRAELDAAGKVSFQDPGGAPGTHRSPRGWGDLTEIPTDEGKLYLATVLDLASRRLPGFAIGEHHDAPLAKAALCMAAAVRGGKVAGVVFHSDKGGEYVGDVFTEACGALGAVQSMGRVGSALDNAAAESFDSTLEFELLSRRHFATKDQARRGRAPHSGARRWLHVPASEPVLSRTVRVRRHDSGGRALLRPDR